MIKLKDISYSYSESKQIINNLNLKIQDGECILLCERGSLY